MLSSNGMQVGVAANPTPLTFTDVGDGDFVVMKTGDCSNAHSTVTTSSSMGKVSMLVRPFGVDVF